MTRNIAVVCLLALSVSCFLAAQTTKETAAPATTATASAPGGWVVAYTNDFSKGKLGDEWLKNEGTTAEIADGMMVIKGGEAEGQVMLKEPKFPGSVKMEFDAVATGDSVSDISPILNGDDAGYANGYLLQFGGKANTKTQLNRIGDVVNSTVTEKFLIKAGQKYHIVVTNDGGKISMTIDGKEAFSYADTSPLKGADHNLVGFYTYGDTLKIGKLTVSKKEAEAPKK